MNGGGAGARKFRKFFRQGTIVAVKSLDDYLSHRLDEVDLHLLPDVRGISSRSRSFSAGRMMRVMPARAAARILSFTPPTGSTLPRSVISPVMAMSRWTGMRVTDESSAVAMVIPADGPSFGIAPSGT